MSVQTSWDGAGRRLSTSSMRSEQGMPSRTRSCHFSSVMSDLSGNNPDKRSSRWPA